MTKLTSLFALLFVLFTVNASAQNPGNSLQFTNQTPPVNKPGTTTSDPMLQQRYAQQAQQAMMAYMMDSISKALSHDIDAKVNAIVGAKLKKLEAKQIKDTKSVLKTVTLVQKHCEDKIKENSDAMQLVNNNVETTKQDMEKTLSTFTTSFKDLEKKVNSIDWKFYFTWGGIAALFIILVIAGIKLNTRINLASTKYDRNMNTLMGDYNTRHNPS